MEYYVNQNTLAENTEKWLHTIAPFNTHKMTLNVDKSALIVVDMQNFFLDPGSPTFTCGGLAVLPNVKHLIDVFRANRRPVIYTAHVHHPDRIDAGIMDWWWDGMCIQGTAESEIHADIAPQTTEKIVYKHRYSAFYNTDLETILRCMKIDDVVITGIMTNMCCESTARDAHYRDYRVFFPADATGSICEEMHVASLLNLAFGFAFINRTDDILETMS
jgi:biuret amidohydrolase